MKRRRNESRRRTDQTEKQYGSDGGKNEWGEERGGFSARDNGET